MYYASDFRMKAREVLRGKWPLAVGTGFIATILLGNDFIPNNTSRVNNEHVSIDPFTRFEHVSYGPFVRIEQGLIDSFVGFQRTYFPVITTFIAIAFIIALIAFIVGGTIEIGYSRFNLNLVREDNPQFTDLFSAFSIWGKGFLMRLLTWIYTLLWSLLLIIPGIIAAISYAMTPYILTENPELSVSEAISMSKDMMMGNKWRYFCLNFSFIGWSFLCALTFGIGYLWLIPYESAAKAVFYEEIAKDYYGRGNSSSDNTSSWNDSTY